MKRKSSVVYGSRKSARRGSYGSAMSVDPVATALGYGSYLPGYAGVASSVLGTGYGLYKALAGGAKSKNIGFRGGSTAGYAGKFQKVHEDISKEEKIDMNYTSLGVVVNKEVHGKIADPDCVYIGHSTFVADDIAIAVATAALRKLFRKAGYNITSIDEVLPLTTDTNASGFAFEYTKINVDLTRTVVSYTTVTGDSIASIANSSGFIGDIKRIYYHDDTTTGTGNHAQFEYLYLRQNTTRILLASVALKNEILHICARSILAIQNRTKGADTSSTGTEQIDSQPLKGYRYFMEGGVPRSKQNDNELINRTTAAGNILVRAAELAPATVWKEPPMPKQFNNCKAYVFVRLEPGSIKTGKITKYWSGYFNNILQRLYTRSKAGYTDSVEMAPGTCELFALEETLNSGSVNNITVNYEKEYRVGAMLVTGKQPLCLMKYYDDVQDNVPP